MKKRLTAAIVSFIMLLQIFATPVLAIEENIEEHLNSKQEEIINQNVEENLNELQEEIVDQNEEEILSEPQEEIINQNEEENVSLRKGPQKGPGDLIKDDTLKEYIIAELREENIISVEEMENHVITIEELEELEDLGASNVYDFSGLEYALNLTALELGGTFNNTFDFTTIENMFILENMTICDVDSFTNLQVVNGLNKLRILTLGFENQDDLYAALSELEKLNRADDLILIIDQKFTDGTADMNEIITALDGLKVKKIFYDKMLEIVNYNTPIDVGSSVTIDFEDLNPIMKNYILNPESKFYRSGFVLDSWFSNVGVDNEHKQITIDTSGFSLGYFSAYFNMSYIIDEEEETGASYIPMTVQYLIVNPGDSTIYIDINDPYFEEQLLNNYDIDRDGYITDLDAKNIEYLDINDVEDYTGLDKFVNLKSLTIINYEDEDETNFNFEFLQNMPNLQSISIDRIGIISWIETLNSPIFSNLTSLNFQFSSVDSVYALNDLNANSNITLSVRLVDRSEENVVAAATALENCKINNLQFDLFDDINLGKILIGSEPIVENFNESPIFANFILNSESRFFVPGFYAESNDDHVIIDNVSKSVTIRTDQEEEPDYIYASISMYSNNGEGDFIGSFNIIFDTTNNANFDVEVEFNDPTFDAYMHENYDFDGDGRITQGDMEQIQDLDLNNIYDFEGLQYAVNLHRLYVNNNIGGHVDFDFSKLHDMNNLSNLYLSNVERVCNCHAINNKANLKHMTIDFYDVYCIGNSLEDLETIARPDDFVLAINHMCSEDDDVVDQVATALENINVKEIYYGALYRQTFVEEKILMGQTRTFTFDEMNPFLKKYILNNSSKFYNNTPNFTSSSPNLTMDLLNKTITIDATNEEEITQHVEFFNYKYETNLGLIIESSFRIAYDVSADGDHDTEINIPDQNLKKTLKDFYDADGNGKITEYDMINIKNLNLNNITDLEGLQYATNMTWISINTRDGALANIDKLNELDKLERVSIYRLKNVDFSDFVGMAGLKQLTISEIESISNESSINNMPNIKCLDLSFRDYGEIHKLSVVEYRNDLGMVISLEPENWNIPVSAQDVENVVYDIEEFNVRPVAFETLYQDVFVGNVEPGTTNEFYFYDVNPWINYTKFHDGSNMYVQNFRLYEPEYDNLQQLEIDNEGQKFIITTGEEDVGDYTACIKLDCTVSPNITYTLSFYLSYKVIAQGRTDYEVTVNDPNLKQILKSKYNFDGNEDIISEFDMFNIDNLDIDEEVYDLTGLEFAKNIKSLRIGNGHISDFSPLRGLTKLQNVSITNFYEEDTNFQFLEDCSDLRSLYISTKGVFDCVILNGREYLNNVVIYANRIFNAPTLNSLENSISYVELKADRLDGIEGFYDLSLNRNNCRVILKFTNNENIIYSNEQYQQFLASTQNIHAPSVNINIDRVIVDLGDIEFGGNSIEINFADISEIVAQVVNNGPFHEDNIMLYQSYRYYPNTNNDVNIDIENEKITLDPESAGERHVYLQLGDEWTYYDGNNLSGIIELRYNAIFGGSKERIIENLDENLAMIIEQQYNVDGEPGVSEYDMQNLTRMYAYSRINHLNGIEEAINLKQLSLSVYSGLDLTPLQSLNKLEQLEIEIEDPDIDLTPIKSIPNLKELNINCYREFGFDVTGLLKQMPNLQTVRVDFAQDSIDFVTSIPNLERVSIVMPKDKDLTPLFEHPSLFSISIFGIDTPLDYNDFNNMDNLNDLTLEFLNVPSLQGTNGGLEVIDYTSYSSNIQLRVESGAISDEDIQNYLNEINKTKGTYNIQNNFNILINLGNMAKGQVRNYETYDEFSRILGATQDQNSKLYSSSIDVAYWCEKYLEVDTTNHTVKVIAPDQLGEYSAQLQINGPSIFGNIYIQFNVITDEGNPNTLYQVADPNLQRILEENYNVDGEPGFSERDLLNLTYLDIHEANITDLTGLENATNLREIQAAGNRITSIAPIINLENLDYADLSNNLLTDVSCLQNRTAEGKPMIWVDANFIDLTDGSASLRALEEKTSLMYMGYIIASQKVGNPEDFDNEVVFESSAITQKLIEQGVETNEQGKITRRTLYESTIENGENGAKVRRLNLDNMNITSLTGFEYLGTIQELILSNNNISNIEQLKYLSNIKELDLSHNNISDLSPLSTYIGSASMGDRTLNYRFAANNISSLSAIDNWKILKNTNEMMETFRNVAISLDENNISDMTCVATWKNLQALDLSRNNISDISCLTNYNFIVNPHYQDGNENKEQLYRFQSIRLVENQIDLEDPGTIAAKSLFDEKGARLELEGDEPPPQFRVGDINDDGIIDGIDCTILIRYLDGYEQLNDVQLLAADINKDGVTDGIDCTILIRYLDGYETIE